MLANTRPLIKLSLELIEEVKTLRSTIPAMPWTRITSYLHDKGVVITTDALVDTCRRHGRIGYSPSGWIFASWCAPNPKHDPRNGRRHTKKNRRDSMKPQLVIPRSSSLGAKSQGPTTSTQTPSGLAVAQNLPVMAAASSVQETTRPLIQVATVSPEQTPVDDDIKDLNIDPSLVPGTPAYRRAVMLARAEKIEQAAKEKTARNAWKKKAIEEIEQREVENGHRRFLESLTPGLVKDPLKKTEN